MRKAALLVVATVVAALLAPSWGVGGAQAASPRYTTSGRWILDSQGRHLVLRGLDVSGMEYIPTDQPLNFGPSDFAAMRAAGATVVRIPFSWALIEPTPGHIDAAALARIKQVVGWAGAAGLLVVVDLHQYLWASCLGGLGIPDWAVPNCPATPPSNVLLQEADAFQAQTVFWQSQSLQADVVDIWADVAQTLGAPAYLVGYDLFNEPPPGFIPPEAFETSYLAPFYRAVGARLRAIDPGALLFAEYSALDGIVNGSSQFLGPLGLPGVVYEPHQYGFVSFNADGVGNGVYDLLGPAQLLPDLMIDQAVARRMDAPVWLGEWGAIAPSASLNPGQYVADDIADQDALMMGSAYWSYDSLFAAGAEGLRQAWERLTPLAIAGPPKAFTTGATTLWLSYAPDGGTTVISIPRGMTAHVHATVGRISAATQSAATLLVTAPKQPALTIQVTAA